MLDVLGAFYEKLKAKNWKLISSEKNFALIMLVSTFPTGFAACT
jgi:hypothetical protein